MASIVAQDELWLGYPDVPEGGVPDQLVQSKDLMRDVSEVGGWRGGEHYRIKSYT